MSRLILIMTDIIRKFENEKREDLSRALIFKKRLYYSVKDSPTDLVELDLVYAEVSPTK